MIMEKTQGILTALAVVRPSTRSEEKAYDASIRQHIALLNSSASEIHALVLNMTKEILEGLDPSLHSISYLFILQMLTETVQNNSQVSSKLILDAIVEFIIKFDPIQIRYAGQPFRILLEKIGGGQMFPASVAVELLVTAILRIEPTGSLFTSTHFVLAQLAYNSNSVEPALRVIDREILFYPHTMNTKVNSVLCDPSLPPTSYISTISGLTDQITSTTVLEYGYIRGLMYMSRREWTKAKEAFEQVILHPTKDRAMSKIMLDSYKRWVLVALLGQGKAPTLPSYSTGTAHLIYEIAAKAYDSVAQAFMSTEAAFLKSQIEENAALWEEDGTSTLLQEVLASYQKWQIVGLRSIYQRAEISMIRRMTVNAVTGKTLENDDAVLTLVRQMMEDGTLNGQLEQDDNGVCYLSFTTSTLTEREFARQIAQSFQNIQSVNQQYKQMNDQLSSTNEYVRHLAIEKNRSDKDGFNHWANYPLQLEDEDLMSGTPKR
ncbi:hypothetical protein E4U15_001275 [Claviceps sp. LM218 group G6]|nr:hypothetical protein E4U15_001275 [Claviceps sp. LM218 group G6]